jgi:predicted MFS family arabinose efflux permease
MAAVGIVAAMTLDLSTTMGIAKQDVGIALSMFSLPSALGAVICGGVVDRFGPRWVIVCSCLACVIGDATAVLGGNATALMLALALNGVGFTGISVAAPAMIVTSTSGERRVRAMSIWSTYAPTAFALGLLMGAPFAGTGHWVPPLVIHAGFMLLLAAAAIALPQVITQAPLGLGDQFRSFGRVFRQIGVLRLSIAVAVPSALSYGTSLISPAYIAQVHGTSIGASVTAVAAVKGVAMLLCGVVTGTLLSRNFHTFLLFAGLALVGLMAQVGIFWPGSNLALAVFGLFAWLVAFGGMSAAAMSLLSGVIESPAQSGTASGFIGQVLSLLSLFAPSIYFGMNHWQGYVLLAGAGLMISTLALPGARTRAAV